MPNGPEDIITGSALRRQTIAVQQIGANVDATLNVAIAAAGAGTGHWFSLPVARGKGRVVRIAGGNLTTALTVDATHDIMPRRYTPRYGQARSVNTLTPLLAAPGLRLTVNDLAGILQSLKEENGVLVEDEKVYKLQAPGGANQIKLAAGASAVDGYWADCDIDIIDGTGKGQKNRGVHYTGGTLILKVWKAEGTPNWKVATDATSVARIRTRRMIVDKDDQFTFGQDFTVGAGAAGVDALSVVELEFDDSVTV